MKPDAYDFAKTPVGASLQAMAEPLFRGSKVTAACEGGSHRHCIGGGGCDCECHLESVTLRIEVLGPAASQGSKVPIRNKAGAVIGSRESSKRTGPWRQDVRMLMANARPEGFKLWDVAVEMTMTLYVPRPKSHYSTGRRFGVQTVKSNAPKFPPSGLDLDKVQRAVGDAATGIWLSNDARISKWTVERLYCGAGEVERTVITCKVRV